MMTRCMRRNVPGGRDQRMRIIVTTTDENEDDFQDRCEFGGSLPRDDYNVVLLASLNSLTGLASETPIGNLGRCDIPLRSDHFPDHRNFVAYRAL